MFPYIVPQAQVVSMKMRWSLAEKDAGMNACMIYQNNIFTQIIHFCPIFCAQLSEISTLEH